MILRRFFFSLTAVFALAAGGPVHADDVGVASARLVELEGNRYALEVDVMPRLLPGFRAPALPDGFTAVGTPSYRQVGVALVVRYEFAGDRPLQAGDVLLLPWGRSAILLTARWIDGEVHRGMFPRSPAGIRVPVELLRAPVSSPARVALRAAAETAEERHVWVAFALLAVGLSIGGRRVARPVMAAFAGGSAMALVLADLTGATIPTALGLALVAVGAATLAWHGLRENESSAGAARLALVIGLLAGLGLAGSVAERVWLLPGDLTAATFGAIVAAAVPTLAVAALLTLVGASQTAVAATGCAAVAASLLIVDLGTRPTVAGLDPADSLAAARLEFSGGGTGPGGGAAAPAPRRLDDPALGFLTVEPTEVRVEILLRLLDFLPTLRIEASPTAVIPVEAQSAIVDRAEQMIRRSMPVVIDGREGVPVLVRSDFVTVAATGVSTREEPQVEPLPTAVLGVTLVYAVERPASEIELTWAAFPAPDTAIPMVWADPTGTEREVITPDQPRLAWANDLSAFVDPPIEAVGVEPPLWPVLSWFLLALAGAGWSARARHLMAGSATAVFLVGAFVAYPFVRQPVPLPGLAGGRPADTELAAVIDDVLTNVYRSFDLRDEAAIYDRLAVSVTGNQLTDVYLENRRALEIENRGGARARVDEVEVVEVRDTRASGGSLRVEAIWTVSGSVNHFGHVHYRQNRYDAALHLVAVDGVWKLEGIEILDERRIL